MSSLLESVRAANIERNEKRRRELVTEELPLFTKKIVKRRKRHGISPERKQPARESKPRPTRSVKTYSKTGYLGCVDGCDLVFRTLSVLLKHLTDFHKLPLASEERLVKLSK